MKSFVVTTAALIWANLPCQASPIWSCKTGPKPDAASPCADPEIVRIDKAIDARMTRLTASADPVTAMLLKRDQRWFLETLTEGKAAELELREEDREGARAKLAARLKMLEAIQPRAGALAGEWVNALLTVKITKGAGDALQVEIVGKVDYPDHDETAECGVKAEVKPGQDGWFAGPPAPLDDEKPKDDKQADATKDTPGVLRLRLQAGTLRVVLIEPERAEFCTAPGFVTGTYFATGAATSGAAPTVAPSFDCKTAKNEDEEEICSDPELARLDIQIAALYRDTLKRLDAKTQAHLRDDQRGWSKMKKDIFSFYLHPAWDKRSYMVHHSSSARDELAKSLEGRIGLLDGLDDGRKGFVGRWIGYNASATITPKKEATDGTLSVTGGKWEGLDYKAHCEFDTDGKIAGNQLNSDDGPRLARDGMTLTVDAHYPDRTRNKDMELKMERPDYCSRMDSAKARLFPVKDGMKVYGGR